MRYESVTSIDLVWGPDEASMQGANDAELDPCLLIGRTLCGKWRLESVIGAGGMSTVYAATHRNGKRVAVKALHGRLAFDTRARKRFLREGFLANNVDHPGAVSVLDEDVDETGVVFLVMELLIGETLDAAWKKAGRRLPVGRALSIMDTVLDVLASAHGKGIVHRDLKPANIFLTRTGEVKVLDFGIAKLRDNVPAGVTHPTGGTLGTPAFMAREQARARWDMVDARTDVWAAGAVLFALLSGQTVYEGETGNEIVIACATQPPRSLASVASDIPPAIVQLVDRALRVNRDERWADAREMQSAVRAMLDGPSSLTTPQLEAQALPASPSTLSESQILAPDSESTPDRNSASATNQGRKRRLLVGAAVLGASLAVIFSVPLFRSSSGNSVHAAPQPTPQPSANQRLHARNLELERVEASVLTGEPRSAAPAARASVSLPVERERRARPAPPRAPAASSASTPPPPKLPAAVEQADNDFADPKLDRRD
jgi:eukaryotic-like serine/threonine-protein kinase